MERTLSMLSMSLSESSLKAIDQLSKALSAREDVASLLKRTRYAIYCLRH